MDENVLGNVVGSLIDRNRDEWGGNAIWFILLLFLFGGNGMWGNRMGNVATQQDVATNSMFTQLDNGIRGLSAGMANLGYDNLAQFNNTNLTMAGGFANLTRAIDGIGFKEQDCCCTTNRNIDSVKYEMAQNTCRVTTNATENTQKILDKLCMMEANAKDNEIARLRYDLQAAQLTLAQGAQTQTIVGALKPSPMPAYIVSSPYCNCNNGGTVIA